MMTRHLGRIAALAGLLLAAWLVWHENPRAVFAALRIAGPGLVVAGLAHVVPMLPNARDWQILFQGRNRPGFLRMLRIVWIRESINGMLPVARIGGEVFSFRLLVRGGLQPAAAAASLVLDLQLTLISQVVFALVGIGYLLAHASPSAVHLARNVGLGLAALVPVLLVFILIQHVNPFERASRLLNRAMSGRLSALVDESAGIDREVRLMWRRSGVILRYLLLWQTLQFAGVALEIWLALHFLHSPVSFLQALVLESLIQAVSSAAFFVPGSLGVQEAGFLVIGGALGLSPPICLALAAARRVRDLLIYVPGLFAWQAAERRGGSRAMETAGRGE